MLNSMQLGIRGEEWIILIIVVVVLLFGAKKIPDLARSVGRARGEFERGKVEGEEEIRKDRENAKKQPAERENLEKAATSFGIPVEGKSDEQLREDMRKVLEKTS